MSGIIWPQWELDEAEEERKMKAADTPAPPHDPPADVAAEELIARGAHFTFGGSPPHLKWRDDMVRAYLASREEVKLHRLNDEIVKLLTPEERGKYGPSVVARLQAAERDRDALREALEQCQGALGSLVEWGYAHESGCPEDDTCRCSLAAAINKALARCAKP